MKINNNLAIVFPGQGSQKVGMMADFANDETLLTTFAEASEAYGEDLWKLTVEGPQERLNLTETTQPVLLAAGIALWRIWLKRGGSVPAFVAGHSLGEWTALVASGVVDFQDAVAIVRARGRYMQEAVPEGQGSMAAIVGMEDSEVEALCHEVTSDVELVSPVNYNCPGQLVIAGHVGAVNKTVELCKAAGARMAKLLPVSGPFHTSLMQPAADNLASTIASTTFHTTEIPIVHNVHAHTEQDSDKIKALMIEQIYRPVRWAGCVRFLLARGVTTVVECGPGRALNGINRKIDRALENYSIEQEKTMAEALVATS